MTERTGRETDNQMNSINEYSEEINDGQEAADYSIDDYTNSTIYSKNYSHPHSTEYAFSNEYSRQSDLWTEPPERYEEYEHSNPASAQWQWDERHEEHMHQWPKKEKKGKKEEQSARKKSKFRVCTNCGTTTTPAWRRSTSNKILLCNACGLYQRLHGSDRPFSVTPEGKTKAIKNNIEKGVCRGCGVSQTPLWKRGHNNEWLCSSCGLLYTKRSRGEEYRQEWPEYAQDTAWKYNSEYQEYSDWPKERESSVQYAYDEKDSEESYFGNDRFREYSGYYSQEKQ
ncbi:hypothetical protein NEMIN01_1411 [Nematocida minor]|uniref:uncharacterized protein n=1 Tax=Nematocida minor TaxID=1912983 RepID=UPI00221F8BA8|nr:uncharacterized protein NEMIN01_1411 [Nematocida minor]KAI5191203.1 hypothetical protein NEMIN01_1411 [Nematocida minor]